MEELRKDKGFRKLLIVEIIIFLALLLMVARKPFSYELNVSNIEIADAAVYIDETTKKVCISSEPAGTEDSSAYARWIAGSPIIDVPFGVYELEVFYESELYPLDNGGGSCADKTATIQLTASELSNAIAYNPIGTYDGSGSSKDRVVIEALPGIRDLQIKVCYLGQGKFALEKVTLRELPIWRVSFLVGIVLIYIFINGFYYYFFMNRNAYRTVAAGIIGTIVFTSMPLFADFLFHGHDLVFHMARILSLANEIEAGRWIAPISDTLNHYGYATPIFYGQLFLYIPAILYNLAVPLQTCYQIYVMIINAVTCIICYNCFKGIVEDNKIAVVGAFLYTAAPYRICNLYLRSAVGEYTAMAFLPLIVYGFIKVYTTDEKRIKMVDWLPITLGLTGVIHSHVLSCEMAAIFIIGICIVFIKKTLQMKRFMALAKAAIFTVLVNLGFLIPLLDSMQMNLNVNTGRLEFIQSTGVYLTQLISPFMTFTGGSVLNEMSGEMPLTMGLSLVLGIALMILCYSKKEDWELNTSLTKIGVVCAVTAICAMLFSLYIFPWDSIEDLSDRLARLLGMVQFSWRYISIALVTASFATVIGLRIYTSNITAKEEVKHIVGIMVGTTFVCVSLFFTQFCNSASTDKMYGFVGAGYNVALGAGGEYLPSGTATEELNRRNINTDISAMSIENYSYEKGTTIFWCKNASKEGSYVEIPVLNYDNYYAFDVNSGKEIMIENGDNNRIRLIIPMEYEGYIQVEYRIPFLWKMAYAISGLTVMGMFIYIIGKKYRKHKSNGTK